MRRWFDPVAEKVHDSGGPGVFDLYQNDGYTTDAGAIRGGSMGILTELAAAKDRARQERLVL